MKYDLDIAFCNGGGKERCLKGQLFLIQGDIVAIVRQIDKNWFEGVKDEKIGIFPVSYIEVL